MVAMSIRNLPGSVVAKFGLESPAPQALVTLFLADLTVFYLSSFSPFQTCVVFFISASVGNPGRNSRLELY